MGTYDEKDDIGTRLPNGKVMNNRTGEVGTVKSQKQTEKDTVAAEKSKTTDKES